jgi:hypothetical protein
MRRRSPSTATPVDKLIGKISAFLKDAGNYWRRRLGGFIVIAQRAPRKITRPQVAAGSSRRRRRLESLCYRKFFE